MHNFARALSAAVIAIVSAGIVVAIAWAAPLREFSFSYDSSVDIYQTDFETTDHFDFWSSIYPGANLSSGDPVELDYAFEFTQNYDGAENNHIYQVVYDTNQWTMVDQISVPHPNDPSPYDVLICDGPDESSYCGVSDIEDDERVYVPIWKDLVETDGRSIRIVNNFLVSHWWESRPAAGDMYHATSGRSTTVDGGVTLDCLSLGGPDCAGVFGIWLGP